MRPSRRRGDTAARHRRLERPQQQRAQRIMVTGIQSMQMHLRRRMEQRLDDARPGRRRSAPTTRITNTAGPSPLSAKARSSPQASQRGATLRKPANSCPSPQRGQRQARPAAKGETRLSACAVITGLQNKQGAACAAPLECNRCGASAVAAVRRPSCPRRRSRRRGTARPRRRSASTRRRIRSRGAAAGVNWPALARIRQTIRKIVPMRRGSRGSRSP